MRFKKALLTSALTGGFLFFNSISALAGPDDFYNELYNNLLVRNPHFTITYNGNYEDVYNGDLDAMFQKVGSIHKAGNSDDFDYMYHNISTMNLSIPSIGGASADFVFDINYRESMERLQEVNADVASVLPELTQGNTVEVIKNIHDFVVNRISYDESLTKYTAYDGIVGQSTVCQGYSLLMYKMLTEAGIPARYVCGQAGTRHAWNIVKVGDKWYFVDATWDDPVGSRPVLRYDYFLVGMNTLSKDHSLDSKFLTPEFMSEYPISDTDYDFNSAEALPLVQQPTNPSTENNQESINSTEPQNNQKRDVILKGETEDYNFDLRSAIRQVIVSSIDETIAKQDASFNDNEKKMLAELFNLQKEIMIAAVMRLSDAELQKLATNADTFTDPIFDAAEQQYRARIFSPVEAYITSPEFAQHLETEWNNTSAATDMAHMSPEMQEKYQESWYEPHMLQKIHEKLSEISQQHSDQLINDLHSQFQAILQ